MFLYFLLGISTAILAADITVSGKVVDVQGEPLIGASVQVKGQSVGTVTDLDGHFEITTAENATLVFSYVGFMECSQAVKGQSSMTVTMQEASQMLSETVVIGYGSLSKKELSSSIVQVDRKDFTLGAMNNPLEMLTGKVAGVNVSTTAAANPNSSSDIQIRGAGSLSTSNAPLIVIDGIAGGDIRNIAPQDIESMTVLKDAGSAAIYGTRGANGVILITTKHGSQNQEGKFTVTYDSYAACHIANARPQVLTPDEFIRSRRGTNFGYKTDWYKEIIKPATYDVNQYIGVNYNTKSGFYAASFNFKDAKGLDIVSARREYGGRFAMEQGFINNHLVLSGSLSARRVNEDWGEDGMVDRALSINPTMPVRNEDGSYYQPTNQTGAVNPVARLKETKSQGKRLYLLANVDLKYNIWHNDVHSISTNVNYALQYNDLKSDTYASSKSNESYWEGYNGRATLEYQKWQTHRVEWLGNYAMHFGEHDLKVVVGYSWERSYYEQMGMSNYDFTFDNTMWNDIAAGSYLGEGLANMGSYKNETTLIGFFGRINYNWNDILFASVSFRREGSSKFGENNKWGNFPSASLAWEMMSCKFMQPAQKVLRSLKPRISYGLTGRCDFNPYQSLAAYGLGSFGANKYAYNINGSWVKGYVPTGNSNSDLRWEKNQVLNVGLDFDLWGRLRGSVEYYNRQSQDLLYNYTAPQPPFVYDHILVNVGTTLNQGVEVALNGDIFKTKDFTWNMGINYSYGTTVLTKLSNDTYHAAYLDLYQKGGVGTTEYYFRVKEGGLVGNFWGYEYAGIDENGNMLVYDNDGKQQLASQADASWKRVIGNGAPKHYLDWNNYFTYKGWDFSMMWRGAFDFDIYNVRRYNMGLRESGSENVLRTAYTDDKALRASSGVISSYFLERGDYFKLDNITIGYTLRVPSAKYFQDMRIFLTAKNICTITRYKGNDPSIVVSTGITPGVDNSSAYPTATQLSLGVTLNLK